MAGLWRGAEQGRAGGALATSPAIRLAADRAARLPGARIVQAFGTDLFRALASAEDAEAAAENLLCSPYSVAVALAMTRNGARGTTAEEMDRVLHATSRAQCRAERAGLHNAADPSTSTARRESRSANSLWGQRGVRWERTVPRRAGRELWHRMRQVDYERRPGGGPPGDQRVDERPDARADP